MPSTEEARQAWTRYVAQGNYPTYLAQSFVAGYGAGVDAVVAAILALVPNGQAVLDQAGIERPKPPRTMEDFDSWYRRTEDEREAKQPKRTPKRRNQPDLDYVEVERS